jgi:predicted dehydrogenase
VAPLGWGLLGTARINRAIIGALRSSSRNALLAVASRSSATAAAYAREWSIPSALAPYDALLADPSIDVVYIALPNTMHVEWTIRALEAGKHVLCEKPLALTVDGVDQIAAAVQRTGRVAAEAFMYRHHPLTDAVLQTIAEGRVGELRLIRGAFTYLLAGRNPDIRMDPALGGGSLWDVGCYPVSYACLVADGLPQSVAGWHETSGGVDIAFAGLLQFSRGIVAQFDSGFRAAFRAEMEIVGTEGVLRVDRPFKAMPESRIVLTRGDRSEDVPFRPDAPYIGEIEELAGTILDGAPQRVPLAESRRTVRTLTALSESARQQRTVTP